MFSGKHKKPQQFHDKLQLLRSVTHSHAMNEASIVLDASKYIKELKHKVERLTQEIATAESSSVHQNHHDSPRVTVETLERGFLVKVANSGDGCPGLLLPILATFEDLGLDVLEARVSCAHTSLHLLAIGGQNGEEENYMEAQSIKRAIHNTMKNWRENIE